VEGSWLLEMPKSSNPHLNYETIVDVLLTFQYTSLDDPAKQPLMPLVVEAAANLSAKLAFPDAFYHLKNPDFYADNYGYDPGQSIPPYTVRFSITDAVLAANQKNRRLRSVAILFDQGEPRKRPITSLRHVEQDVVVWSDTATDDNGFVRSATPGTDALTGTWELTFLHDPAAWASTVGSVSSLAPDFNLTDLAAADVEPYDLFRWDDVNGQPEPEQINGHAALDLAWLGDVLVMFEYECLIG
jgi:hypothetical protein